MRFKRSSLLATGFGLVACALLAAGCGGAGSPGVARIASSTSTTTTPQSGPVAFSLCMRSHAVPGFPDPNSSGAFDPDTLKRLRVSESTIRAANTRCTRLLPNGVVPLTPPYTITAADQLDYLKGATCMRRHGFPEFPDPTFEKHNVSLNIPSRLNLNSPQFKSAAATCQKLIPAGLPYSGSS